jgi:predicted phosphodiesterase
MKFQYISDLHLETGNKIHLIPSAPNLIIVGDIGHPFDQEYITFIKTLSALFEHIFIITGNHEYYTKSGKTMQETDDYIRNLLIELPSCHFLNNEVFHMPNSNISIFGSTFWSEIDENESRNIKMFVRDYVLIPGFTPTISNELHAKAIESLAKNIAKHLDRKWIVISHHIPKYDLIHDRYKNNPFNSAFASNNKELADILDQENVQVVVYGHTHMADIRGKYYCNPFGYPQENERHVNIMAMSRCLEL